METTVTLYNVQKLLLTNLIQLTPVYSPSRRRYFVLDRAITVELSTGITVSLPEGFKTDLSSVPRWLWSVTSPYGNFLLAALIHDYLYVYNVGNRRDADREMLLWSMVINENVTDNYLRYRMVRIFGGSWWQRAAERIQRERLVVQQ